MRHLPLATALVGLALALGCTPLSPYRIAFIASVATPNSTAMASVGARGGGVQLVTSRPTLYNSVAYSRDGAAIAYTAIDDISISSKGVAVKGSLHTMSKDGSDMKTVTEQNLAMSDVAFSPSKQLLSFVMKDATGMDNVFLVGILGHDVRQLTREGGTGPSWGGDDKLLFAHDDAVYQIGVDGLGLTKVAKVSGSTVFRPSLSPRGDMILFTSRTYGNPSSYSVHLFNRADGSMRSLVTEELPSWESGWRPEAIWSPAGDEIAFLSYRSGINTILGDGSNRASLKIRGSGMVSFMPAVGH